MVRNRSPTADFAAGQHRTQAEDQLFELVMCAAVASLPGCRRREVAALAEAIAAGRPVVRLDILTRGDRPGTKLPFTSPADSRHPVPDAAKLVFTGPNSTTQAKEFSHEAMRGPPPGR